VLAEPSHELRREVLGNCERLGHATTLSAVSSGECITRCYKEFVEFLGRRFEPKEAYS
jgi:hypothetical protein